MAWRERRIMAQLYAHKLRLVLALSVFLISLASARPLVIGYYPSWQSYSSLDMLSIPLHYDIVILQSLTPTNIANGLPSDISNPDVAIKKFHTNNVKVLVQVGGGGACGQDGKQDFLFADKAASITFAQQVADTVTFFGVDGVEIHYPCNPQSPDNAVAFLQELKKNLGSSKIIAWQTPYGIGTDKDDSQKITTYKAVLSLLTFTTWRTFGTDVQNEATARSSALQQLNTVLGRSCQTVALVTCTGNNCADASDPLAGTETWIKAMSSSQCRGLAISSIAEEMNSIGFKTERVPELLSKKASDEFRKLGTDPLIVMTPADIQSANADVNSSSSTKARQEGQILGLSMTNFALLFASTLVVIGILALAAALFVRKRRSDGSTREINGTPTSVYRKSFAGGAFVKKTTPLESRNSRLSTNWTPQAIPPSRGTEGGQLFEVHLKDCDMNVRVNAEQLAELKKVHHENMSIVTVSPRATPTSVSSYFTRISNNNLKF